MIEAICTTDPVEHRRFITSGHVEEEWLVTDHGEHIDTRRTLETTSGPSIDDQWSCQDCGGVPVVVESEQSDPYTDAQRRYMVLLRDELAKARIAHAPDVEEITDEEHFALVENSTHDNREVHVSMHASATDAVTYYDEQDEPGYWDIDEVIDLATGERFGAETKSVTTIITKGADEPAG